MGQVQEQLAVKREVDARKAFMVSSRVLRLTCLRGVLSHLATGVRYRAAYEMDEKVVEERHRLELAWDSRKSRL
jgi:hypothetical protein